MKFSRSTGGSGGDFGPPERVHKVFEAKDIQKGELGRGELRRFMQKFLERWEDDLRHVLALRSSEGTLKQLGNS
jgi:hypothetical protein